MIVLEDYLPSYWYTMNSNFDIDYPNHMHFVYNLKVTYPGWAIEVDVTDFEVLPTKCHKQ